MIIFPFVVAFVMNVLHAHACSVIFASFTPDNIQEHARASSALMYTNGFSEVDYGVYILKNGTQYPDPYVIPQSLYDRMDDATYGCKTFVAIITDDYEVMYNHIEEWMRHECNRLNIGKCLILSNSEDATPPREFLPMRPRLHQAHTITPAPTHHPTLHKKCTSIPTMNDCSSLPECQWFGPLVGCQLQTFCDLPNVEACLMRKTYCIWRGRKCVRK